MKRFIAICGVIASLALPSPSLAGLGPAENIKKEFDAWCAKTKNDCKVTFSSDSLTIDGTHSVSRSDLKKYETINRFYCAAASGISSSKCYGKGTTLSTPRVASSCTLRRGNLERLRDPGFFVLRL